jgi:hypothetical protein
MKQTGLTQQQPIFIVSALLSTVLWLVSLVLAGLCFFAVRDVFIWGLALILTGPDRLSQLRAENYVTLAHNCAMIIVGVVDLGVIIFITEYFFRHTGQPRLLRFLAWTLAIEGAILLPVALLFWRQ